MFRTCTLFQSVKYAMIQVDIVMRNLYFVALEPHRLWKFHLHNDRGIRCHSWNHYLIMQLSELNNMFFSFQSDWNVILQYFWNAKYLWSAETLENEDYDALARRRRRKIWGIFGLYLGRLLRIPPLVYYRSTTRGGILNINTTDVSPRHNHFNS